MEYERIEDIIDIKEWKTPATDYPEKEFGSARIVRRFYKKGLYYNYGVRGPKYFKVTKKIPVTCLDIKDNRYNKENGKWQTWMVDDVPHWWSMQDYAMNSSGKVLVAGLGLGLVTEELLNNVDVCSITVIEHNKDVINLISDLLPKAIDVQFEIINKDFYEFINDTNNKFDRIIVDLWTSGSVKETLRILREEVIPLKSYMRKLFPDASIVFHGFGSI